MSSTTNLSSPVETKTAARQAGVMALCLIGLLGVLFVRSFAAHQTLFSQDGPLGVIGSQADWAVSNFKGTWRHLNWIGEKSFASPPNVTNPLFITLGLIPFSKFYTPISLLLLGLGAWLLFRQLGLRPWVCLLGGLALALNTDPFSYACWGLASLPLSMFGFVLGLAALAKPAGSHPWLRTALAGSAIGLAIMEGYDNGAIFSLYLAAFALFQSWNSSARPVKGLALGITRIALIAVVAGLVAAHTLSTLIVTQIKGVAVIEKKTAEQRGWDWATQWSLPKVESLRLIIPGLFGYRMDTPEGGNYWGTVGRQPGWEQHHQGLSRHSGAGVYAGVLVVFVAFWAFFQSTRGAQSVFQLHERRFVWFWSAAAAVSLALAWGRHAPFYQFIYPLPFFSTMRNPIKFIHPLSVALVILFGYGLEALARASFAQLKQRSSSLQTHLKTWWKTAPAFERKWTTGSVLLLAAGLLGWLVYASSRKTLEQFLTRADIPPELAPMIAKFSVAEVGWFFLFLLLSVALFVLTLSGWFNGARARFAGILFGIVLVADLCRANTPWIVYYDYAQKYATNPIIDLLRNKPYEQRVVGRLLPGGSGMYPSPEPVFSAVYETWLQHHFEYYQIQSLDITQMPRMPQLDDVFLKGLQPSNTNEFPLIGRLWQLTNTRYVLGSKSYFDFLNQQIDPGHRFRVHTSFDFAAAPNAPPGRPRQVEDITAVIRPEGQFAIFEFTGALPRAALFSNWQASTNDETTLSRLRDPAFDPTQVVLVSNNAPASPPASATNQPPGSVEITSYAPKQIALKAHVTTVSVLLLNERYDSDWQVRVDGKIEPLLRANYIMRGVLLPVGDHQIEFRYEPPVTSLYVSLAAIAVCLVFCGILAVAPTRPDPQAASGSRPATSKVPASKTA